MLLLFNAYMCWSLLIYSSIIMILHFILDSCPVLEGVHCFCCCTLLWFVTAIFLNQITGCLLKYMYLNITVLQQWCSGWLLLAVLHGFEILKTVYSEPLKHYYWNLSWSPLSDTQACTMGILFTQDE